MNKKFVIPLVIVCLLLIGGVVYLAVSLNSQKQANKEMQELAELDKKEMENEYQMFADQYSELKTQINNDSIIEQLTQEQMKTEKLLQELKNVKASDAREIARLKKELATCRAVIRSYVLEIDSLNRLNQNLTAENTRVKGQYAEATRQIEGLNADKQSLSEKVAIAAQLDATGISMAQCFLAVELLPMKIGACLIRCVKSLNIRAMKLRLRLIGLLMNFLAREHIM